MAENGSGEENINVKSLQTDRQTDRRTDSQTTGDQKKLTWAFSSGELKTKSYFQAIPFWYKMLDFIACWNVFK